MLFVDKRLQMKGDYRFRCIMEKGIMNIQIENSIKDTPKVRNGIYLTTKSRKEGHGIGLQKM